MPKEIQQGKSTTRRYSEEEKSQAVRLVRQLRRELGTEHANETYHHHHHHHHHHRRRQARLGPLTPVEFETIMTPQPAAAA